MGISPFGSSIGIMVRMGVTNAIVDTCMRRFTVVIHVGSNNACSSNVCLCSSTTNVTMMVKQNTMSRKQK